MRAFQATLCFVFVASCFGQGDYSGRRRGGFSNRGMDMGDMFDGGLGMASLMSLQGGGMGAEPGFVKQVLGSTISGRPLMPGEILADGTALPRHGGTRDPSGLSMGWGADPSLPMIQDGWTDPLRGMAFPTDYAGEELIFDSNLNRYVVAQHNAQKAGAFMGGVGGMGRTNVVHEVNKVGATGIAGIGASPVAAQSGHLAAKQSIGNAAAIVDQQTFGGVSRGDQFANMAAANLAQDSLHVAKKTVGMASANTALGGAGMIGGAGAPLGAVNHVVHNIAKTNAMVGRPIPAGKPAFNKITGGHIPLGEISAGTLGVDPVGVIAHNVGKATLGADQMIGHNIAKSANVPTGTGFIDPATAMVGKAPLVGGPMVGGPMVGGPMVGGPMVGGPMVGGMGRTNVVHEVNKVGATGIAGIGASPVAAQSGHLAAKQSIGNAAAIVDQQTFGGVSRGDQFANMAAANLAQDSLHVAKKTVGMASANTALGGAGMMGGAGVIGGPAMVGGPAMIGGPVLPVASKGLVRPKGYEGRSRF